MKRLLEKTWVVSARTRGKGAANSRIRRALVGISVAVLAMTVVGTPAMADPKPSIPATATPGGAVPDGFTDWNEVYAYQTRLNAAAEQILGAGDAGNASIVASPTNHELRVYWKGAVPAKVRTLAAGLDVPVTFHPAAFAHSELVTSAKRLASDPRVTQAAPKADGSGLAVTVTAPLRQTDQDGLSASATVPLDVTVGKRSAAMTGRQADIQPYWGGSRYNGTVDGACSNGIPVKLSGTFYMLTAGHCGDNGTAANIPGQSTPTGTFFGKSTCRDTALINYAGAIQPQLYAGGPTSFNSRPIVGATPDFVGNLVTTSGASSGEHPNLRVVFVDVFTTVSGIPCGNAVGPLTLARDDSGACATAPGDSGGPVYSLLGFNVLARGTITGGSVGDASCPGDFPSGGSTVLYAPLVRPAGDTDIGSLRFYGAEAPATTVFDLNGAWTDFPGHSSGPVISVLDRTITVDMSAFHRPTAHGSVIDTTHITVTFPDDTTYTGQLLAPRTILWSNNSTWTKL
jgi:hypothetical protein